MIRLGSDSTRPNGGCQEHAPILTIQLDREDGKGLTLEVADWSQLLTGRHLVRWELYEYE